MKFEQFLTVLQLSVVGNQLKPLKFVLFPLKQRSKPLNQKKWFCLSKIWWSMKTVVFQLLKICPWMFVLERLLVLRGLMEMVSLN
ncbi:Uncharacterised protein [Mycobacterium tuberculosis]|nr:Uncharacterised protein [Mycobacterium tuberculosis]